MADQVTMRSKDPFTRVPNVTARASMSPDALGVLVYALSHSRRWRLTREDLMEHFGIGKDRLTRIFRELEDLGYRDVLRTRGDNGRISTVILWFDKPKDQFAADIRADQPPPGYPDDGGPGGKYLEEHLQKMTASSSSSRRSTSSSAVCECGHAEGWCICDD